MQNLTYRCDKCGAPCEHVKSARHSFDLCSAHRDELARWLNSPLTVVGLAGELVPSTLPPAPLELEQPGELEPSALPAAGPLPAQQPPWTPSLGRGAAAGPPPAPQLAVAPGRPVLGSADAQAPTRPVAPGFPLPGAAPDPAGDNAAVLASMLATAPVMPLLEHPPGLELSGESVGLAELVPEGFERAPHELEPARPLEPLQPEPSTLAVEALWDCTCRVKAMVEMDPMCQVPHARSCAAGYRLIEEATARGRVALENLRAGRAPIAMSAPAPEPVAEQLAPQLVMLSSTIRPMTDEERERAAQRIAIASAPKPTASELAEARAALAPSAVLPTDKPDLDPIEPGIEPGAA